jgi:SPX domain protein involved in polyphosphate accumulation
MAGGIIVDQQFQGVFKRYEIKYLINETKFKLLRQRFQEELILDHYGKATVCNIYYDTLDFLLVRSSLEKPVYKEKLRLRSYGTPAANDRVFIELKKKYQGIVYKRRIHAELTDAVNYLNGQKKALEPSQIKSEIDWFISFYKNLRPAMYIAYDRIALHGVENPELRVTFDHNIRYREEDLRLDSKNFGYPLLKEGICLMEVKISGAMPLWMSEILSELEIFPVSFSKYGRGYETLLERKKTLGKGDIKYA